MTKETRSGFVFPAIRGIQAGREYYMSMCRLRLIPKIFFFDEEEANLTAELRAQRTLNKSRVPELARYVLGNRDDYVFSALTASIDADVTFEAIDDEGEASNIGTLSVPFEAKFIINDGQHRRAAIEMALHEDPELAEESIAVVFFIDHGLARCQQMFADLNRYSIRPSKSIGVLYDHRDSLARIAKLVALKSDTFKELVETESSSLSKRSRKLFTLSAIYNATGKLLADQNDEDESKLAEKAIEYWNEVAKCFPEWQFVREGKMLAGEVRSDFIHSHGTALSALGTAGCELLKNSKADWKKRLKLLKEIDWSRSNQKLWEGRATVQGRVSKSHKNVALTTNIIKRQLDLPLSADEKRIETEFRRRQNGKKSK